MGLATLFVTVGVTEKAEAQLVLVESKYRVVTVDRAGQRIGIALPDADPKIRQNWLYIRPDTNISRRHHLGGGAFRDQSLNYNSFFDLAPSLRGSLIRIHGGRDWDGSIDAKTIWM